MAFDSNHTWRSNSLGQTFYHCKGSNENDGLIDGSSKLLKNCNNDNSDSKWFMNDAKVFRITIHSIVLRKRCKLRCWFQRWLKRSRFHLALYHKSKIAIIWSQRGMGRTNRTHITWPTTMASATITLLLTHQTSPTWEETFSWEHRQDAPFCIDLIAKRSYTSCFNWKLYSIASFRIAKY